MRKALLILVCLPFVLAAQPPEQPNAAELRLRLEKLNVLASVLYMAAHPDDENTRIITTLSKGRLATTAYLSLTRGDGGQNLIGPEIRDLLGVIRTQELLAARRIDGGGQFFTRANDFGFSKSADEAFKVWGKEEILSDVLRVFRTFQPDVIITRFPPDERAGHGHHTASAVLAGEAFDLSGREDVLPAQVKEFGTWQPIRLYTNTGRWWNRDINENTPGVISLDVGSYSALLGKSYSEIAARSSSQHKSQGWGQSANRGSFLEFLEYQKGEKASRDILDDIDTSWKRVKEGAHVGTLVDAAIRSFDEKNPAAIVPQLLQIRKAIAGLEPGVWTKRKLAETDQLIVDCLGLYLSATAQHYHGVAGEQVRSTLEILNRSDLAVELRAVKAPALEWDSTFTLPLKQNAKSLVVTRSIVPQNLAAAGPYWLSAPHEPGIFQVADKKLIGKPQNDASIEFIFSVSVNGETFDIARPLIHQWTDPVKGELWRPFEIVPPVVMNLTDRVVVFNDEQPRDFRILVRSLGASAANGTLSLSLPPGWRAEPASISFELAKRGDELIRTFTVSPPASASKGVVRAVADIGGKKFDNAIQYIDYEHIPIQTLLPEAVTSVVKLDLKKEGDRIAYIRGAGDEVPAALRNMGYDVWEMKNEEVTLDNLRKTDAVVMGVRAVNTNSRIRYFMSDLLEYVREGGTLIMQYNTNSDLEVETFSPFPLKISRERVTDENAAVTILKPGHAVFNSPNKITEADFAGWVQERGLYFPNQWDSSFEPLLSMADGTEKPKEGSLLVAQYGKGHYVYTGLSFFRQLPEGVPGAYRLFANLVSLGKPAKEASGKTKSKKQTR